MSNWLSELTTRAVSVLEDVDQLAAESLSTSPGDRIKRRVELRAARRKAKSSEPPAASEPAAAAAATASGQAEAASEASGEETQGEAKAEARTPAAQRSTARVPAEVNNGSHEPLVRENALLKSEISSLEEEIAALAERLRTAQEALAESRAALATAERSLSDARREKQQTAVELRALQRREEEAVQAKRRLQTQLDEAQAQLQAQQAHVQGQASASAQQQPQTEITQHADSQSLLARDDAQLRDRLAVVEAELQAAKAERDDFQRQTEDQQRALAHLQSQVATAQRRNERLNKDFEEYKVRAQRVLHSKEALLETLKRGGSSQVDANNVDTSGSPTAGTPYSAEGPIPSFAEQQRLEELLAEARAEISELQQRLDELEEQSQNEADQAAAHFRDLEQALEQERNRRLESERDYQSHIKSVASERDEALRSKQAMHIRVQESEAQAQQLNKQLRELRAAQASNVATAKSNPDTAEGQRLAEELLRRQNELESLRTQNGNLRVQLEAERRRADDATTVVQEKLTLSRWDDGGHMLPIFSVGQPSSSHIRSAANALDAFSIQIGVFLRRYPMARVAIICYMVILHAWVMIVLLTYQPEMHNDHSSGSFHPQHPEVVAARPSP